MHKVWMRLCLTLAIARPSLLLATEQGGTAVNIVDAQGQEVLLYGGSYALLVGESDYQSGWPNLPGVKEDLKSVREALEKQNFKVTVIENASARALGSAYDDFIARYGRQENDRLLFYYAGHGHTVKHSWGGEMGYIVPSDAPNPNTDPDGFVSKAVDMQQFEVYAKRLDSKHALFVFDSCFSGSMFNTSRAVPDSISHKTAYPVRQFITAGGANEQVPDQSVFRKQFVSGLGGEADTNGDGYVTGSELGEFLQNTVINYSRDMQHPLYGKIRQPELDKGDFVFQLAMLSPPKPQVLTPPPPVLMVGHVQINVTSTEARVYFNDKYVGKAGPDSPLNQYHVPAGPLEVRVEAEGYQAETRKAQVSVGQWVQQVFMLSPLATQKPSQAAVAGSAEPMPSAKQTLAPSPETPPVSESAQEPTRPVAAAAGEPAERRPAAMEAKIQRLLGEARESLAADRLDSPPENNALAYAEQALGIEPKHPQARQLLIDLVRRRIALGESALKEGDLRAARTHQRLARDLASKYHLPPADWRRLARSIAKQQQDGLEPSAQAAIDPKGTFPARERAQRDKVAERGLKGFTKACTDLHMQFGLGEELTVQQKASLERQCN